MKKRIIAAAAIALATIMCSGPDKEKNNRKPDAGTNAIDKESSLPGAKVADGSSSIAKKSSQVNAPFPLENSSGKPADGKTFTQGGRKKEKRSFTEKILLNMEDEIKKEQKGEGKELSPGEQKIANEIERDTEEYIHPGQAGRFGVANRSEVSGSQSSEGLSFFVNYTLSPSLSLAIDVEIMKNMQTWRDFWEFRAGIGSYRGFFYLEAGLRGDAESLGLILVSPYALAKVYYQAGKWLLEAYGYSGAPESPIHVLEKGLKVTYGGLRGHRFFIEAERKTTTVKGGGKRKASSRQLEMGIEFGF